VFFIFSTNISPLKRLSGSLISCISIYNKSNIKIARGDSVFYQEAIRIMNLMPNWEPAKQGNKKVPVIWVVPIEFKLNN